MKLLRKHFEIRSDEPDCWTEAFPMRAEAAELF
jgi:hypothetical protein